MGISPSGKPIVKSFVSKTQKGAKEKLKQFKKQIDFNEIAFMKEKMPFVQYANYWMYEVKFNKVKSYSFDRIESSMKCHVISYFEFYYINDPTIYLTALENTGFSRA